MKVLLVDGHNLLFQMYFGMPSRIVNKSGQAIQGTLGFVGALLRMIRMTSPTHAAVLFDGEHENPRAQLDAGYKANREDFRDAEESPFDQLPDICEALDYLGIRHTEVAEGETDDAMAAYVHTLRDKAEIVIASQDSDFFQLIRPNVQVLRYRGELSRLCGEEWLNEKYGVRPEQYADFKSLTGDGSDNIPGVPGIGSVTAARLLRQFGSLDELLTRMDDISRPTLREAIRTHADRLQLNRRLITLDGGCPLPIPAEEMAWSDREITSTQVLTAIGLKP
ncbi:MAG: 5'-3' exonuclease [Clostridia bacterium]|nr:5'-3' exonuclease [Clostridia bacterium]